MEPDNHCNLSKINLNLNTFLILYLLQICNHLKTGKNVCLIFQLCLNVRKFKLFKNRTGTQCNDQCSYSKRIYNLKDKWEVFQIQHLSLFWKHIDYRVKDEILSEHSSRSISAFDLKDGKTDE